MIIFEVDLTTLLIKECTSLSPLAMIKDIDMSFQEKQRATAKGNGSSLRLLVRNLLTNAIYYTHSDGKLMIDLSSNYSKSVVFIEDNGPGV